ncbi:MAG: hypothetical protein MPL62_17895, partial [Alphaproteobacteria bacterium]|nr:hypothetical protein [Alphaproteobacteria bacterium]
GETGHDLSAAIVSRAPAERKLSAAEIARGLCAKNHKRRGGDLAGLAFHHHFQGTHMPITIKGEGRKDAAKKHAAKKHGGAARLHQRGKKSAGGATMPGADRPHRPRPKRK